MLTIVQFMSGEEDVFEMIENVVFTHTGTRGTSGDRLKIANWDPDEYVYSVKFPDLDTIHHFKVGKPIKITRRVIFDPEFPTTSSRTVKSASVFLITMNDAYVVFAMEWSVGSASNAPNILSILYYNGTSNIYNNVFSNTLVSTGSWPYRQNDLEVGFSIALDVNGDYIVYPSVELNKVAYTFPSNLASVTIAAEDFILPEMYLLNEKAPGQFYPIVALGGWE